MASQSVSVPSELLNEVESLVILCESASATLGQLAELLNVLSENPPGARELALLGRFAACDWSCTLDGKREEVSALLDALHQAPERAAA